MAPRGTYSGNGKMKWQLDAEYKKRKKIKKEKERKKMEKIQRKEAKNALEVAQKC